MSETKRVSFLNIFCRNVGGDAGLLLSDLLAGELERGDEMRDGEGREAAGGDVVAGARDGEKGGAPDRSSTSCCSDWPWRWGKKEDKVQRLNLGGSPAR
jgi:hypothetical protein